MANKIITFSQDTIQQRLQDTPLEVFLDINMKAKQQGDTFSIGKLVNVNAIRNSLDNIFSWTPGERVLNPEFGTNLRKLLYEGITDFNVEQIVAEIKHAVAQWEPRVQVANIVDVSTTEDHENNTVHLKVIYTIPGLSDQQFAYDYVTPTERA